MTAYSHASILCTVPQDCTLLASERWVVLDIWTCCVIARVSTRVKVYERQRERPVLYYSSQRVSYILYIIQLHFSTESHH